MKHDIPPLTVVELRLAISVVLLAAGFALFKPALFRIARTDVLPLVVLGIFGIAAVQGSYYTNVRWVGVGLAILLQYLAPTLVVAWEALVARRRPSRIELAALVSATVGVALLVLADHGAIARANPRGIALGLASAVFFAFYILYAKRLLARLPPWTVLFYGFLVAALFWMVFVPPAAIAAAHYAGPTWGLFLLIALARRSCRSRSSTRGWRASTPRAPAWWRCSSRSWRSGRRRGGWERGSRHRRGRGRRSSCWVSD
jgi:drug/metabolite transporter (DMT)-like permease